MEGDECPGSAGALGFQSAPRAPAGSSEQLGTLGRPNWAQLAMLPATGLLWL